MIWAIHAYDLGQISHGAACFWPKTGGQIGQKCCGWLKFPCRIPIPGCIILLCELNLTLECFCSSLQSCLYVIWARVAPKLFILPKFGGRLGISSVIGWKIHVRFPSQSSKTLIMKQFWDWVVSAAIYNHLHTSFWPNEPWSCSFLARIGS